VIGAGAPAIFSSGASGAVLIGVSMVPRAEIALVVAREGQRLDGWALPPEVYSAVVLVVAATCTLAPITVAALLRRWPQSG
jgi:Kef-type K+ transport system membrane component KefB